MKVDNFEIDIIDDILVFKSKNQTVSLEDAKNLHQLMEDSTLKKYDYGIYKNLLGYYAGYDFEENKTIYCGTLNEKTSINQVKEYANNKNRSN